MNKPPNLWRMMPDHIARFAGTWSEDLAKDVLAAEVLPRMTDGGARVSDFDLASYLSEVYVSPTP